MKPTLLVVDDETMIAEMFKELLSGMGMNVLTANSAKQAIEVFTNNSHIDLVLTDVCMGEENGDTLCQHIRRINPRIQILAMTGHLTFEGDSPCFDMVFNKPMVNGDIQQIVDLAKMNYKHRKGA